MLIFRRLFSTRQHSPIEQLNSLSKLSIAVNATSSNIEKQAILNKFPASHSTLKRIYDPHLRHYVTSKQVLAYLNKQHPAAETKTYTDLNELLDALSSRQITGHAAYRSVALFYTTYCQTEALRSIFWRIIDRNLKMGVSVRSIRHLLTTTTTENKQQDSKVSSNISVALATSYSSTKKNPFQISDGWHVSQKLDGIRCLTMIRITSDNNYDVQFYSRTGRPFTSLQKVKLDIINRLQATAAHDKDEFVLDGEICAYNIGNEKEDFLKAMGQIRRINEEMENPIYQVFDHIQLQSFLNAKGDQTFSERQGLLKKFIGNDNQLSHIKLVEQKKLTSMDQLDLMKKEAIEKGWEGLILRKDVSYEGKRTRNMMKVKEWEDAEYIVKSIETGLMRMPDTGEDKLVVTNVIIEHKGNNVSVGSGFSMHSRISYAEDPSRIIGKPITVRYFSESKKENGTVSLRFPSVKAVYDDGKRDI